MDRKVKTAKRDRDGNIIALCNAGQSWSPRRAKDVIRDISTGRMSYYVQPAPGGPRAYLRAISGVLRTASDGTDDRLTELPTT